MRSPLAFDDDGQPIDLPASSRLWRVKQASGKAGGRPRFVRTEGGQPLTLPLDATFHDLRAEGCAPGAYRLEAIDQDGQPAGFELPIDLTPAAGSPETDTAANKADVIVKAFDSLTGAIEQMQKVQLEREKTQGAIFIALIERLGVSPVAAAAAKQPNVLDTLKQLADAQKLFNKTAKELAPAAAEETQDNAPAADNTAANIAAFMPVLQFLQPMVGALEKKITGKPLSTVERSEMRMELILEHFTPEAAAAIIKAQQKLPPAQLESLMTHLLSLPISKAVDAVQQFLDIAEGAAKAASTAAPPTTAATSNGGTNGTHA
jgi:hypothetical protein